MTDTKRMLVSLNTSTEVWTDDTGDHWKRFTQRETKCTEGVWVVYDRTNDYDPRVLSVHSGELEALRAAALLLDFRAKTEFVAWDSAFNPDAIATSSRAGTE